MDLITKILLVLLVSLFPKEYEEVELTQAYFLENL